MSTSYARAWYALGVLVLATLFAFVDRQILVVIVDPLKHDLGLRDVQIGALQGLAFAVFSVVAAIPLAWLADRFERSRVLAGCVLFWSVATAACGFATNFATLFEATVGVAIGEAALVPIVYSLIPDLFPGNRRQRANILYFAASVLGSGLGLALAGLTLGWVESLRPMIPQGMRALAGWRLTFMAVAVPGPLIALGVGFIGPTGRALRTAGAPVTDRLAAYYRTHVRTVLGVYLGSGFGQLVGRALFAWLPVAMARALGLDPAAMGAKFGLSLAAGAGTGLLLAAITGPSWRRWAGVAAVPRAISVTSVMAVVPTLLLGFTVHLWAAYLLVGMIISLVMTGMALSPTMYQDMAPPTIRARVIAALTVTYTLMSAAGPFLVGAISDYVPGNPRGLLWATSSVMTLGFILCALCFRASESSFRHTVATLQSVRSTESRGTAS